MKQLLKWVTEILPGHLMALVPHVKWELDSLFPGSQRTDKKQHPRKSVTLAVEPKRQNFSFFLTAPKSWEMLLEYRIDTWTVTRDNTVVISVSMSVTGCDYRQQPSHSNYRRKQLIFMHKNFHKIIYWSRHKNMSLRYVPRNTSIKCYIYHRK